MGVSAAENLVCKEVCHLGQTEEMEKQERRRARKQFRGSGAKHFMVKRGCALEIFIFESSGGRGKKKMLQRGGQGPDGKRAAGDSRP